MMRLSILIVRALTAAVAVSWLIVLLDDKNNNVSVDAFLLKSRLPWQASSSASSCLFATTPTETTAQAQPPAQQRLPSLEWKVYVDQSQASLDKGGSATLDAFLGLAPAAIVQVQPALLPTGSYYATPNVGSTASSGSSSSSSSSSNNNVGPFVRCIPLQMDSDDDDDSRRAFDVRNVDSVDKVYRILTKHMRVQGVTTAACDCLKWKYKANGFLEAGQIALAIDAYDKALEIVANSKVINNKDKNSTTTTTFTTTSSTSLHHQEGALYLMRATAYLQRARRLRKELQGTVQKFSTLVSSSSSTSSLSKSHQSVTTALLRTVEEMSHHPSDKQEEEEDDEQEEEEEKEASFLSSLLGSKSSSPPSASAAATNAAATVAALQQSIFRRILRDAERQEFQFRRTLYMHGLYQHALLQAAQDALYATELLPDYPTAWQQAGDVFSDLWKLPESTLFYQRAIQLNDDEGEGEGEGDDPRPRRRRLETTLKPVIERLKRRQQLLDQARSYYGWSEDTLRLALDVAATSSQVDQKNL